MGNMSQDFYSSYENSFITSDTYDTISMLVGIESFRELFPNSIIHRIDNDAMAPLYEVGDYVGAIRLSAKYESMLIGEHNCLVKLDQSNKTIIRTVLIKDGTLTLKRINSSAQHDNLMILEGDPLPVLIAPIIFHRKPLYCKFRKEFTHKKNSI